MMRYRIKAVAVCRDRSYLLGVRSVLVSSKPNLMGLRADWVPLGANFEPNYVARLPNNTTVITHYLDELMVNFDRFQLETILPTIAAITFTDTAPRLNLALAIVESGYEQAGETTIWEEDNKWSEYLQKLFAKTTART
ncbi:hypothetical protein KC722_03295 [Candidatus Kaiserbacteria bacterium]|nr:hypothetical protein [Candidatus Kaiserbacteria bacterium]